MFSKFEIKLWSVARRRPDGGSFEAARGFVHSPYNVRTRSKWTNHSSCQLAQEQNTKFRHGLLISSTFFCYSFFFFFCSGDTFTVAEVRPTTFLTGNMYLSLVFGVCRWWWSVMSMVSTSTCSTSWRSGDQTTACYFSETTWVSQILENDTVSMLQSVAVDSDAWSEAQSVVLA